MTKFSTRVKSILLAFTMTIQVFAGVGAFSITAYADTTNADGSITKMATYCNGTQLCSGTPIVTDQRGECSYCGTINDTTGMWCSTCDSHVIFGEFTCTSCGRHSRENNLTIDSSYHHFASPCGHSKSSPHYYDTAYGYCSSGSSASEKTFTVWPITVVGKNGITCTVQVVGVTAKDAAFSGKTVLVYSSGVAAGTEIRITNSGTGATQTTTLSSAPYVFTMPAAATVVTVELATIDATTSANITSLSKTYLDSAFDVSSYFTTNSDGAKTYSSSDTTVATVSGSTVTINKAGSCTITMNTAATSSYYASSASFTLNVVKATPTLSGISASAIYYGQTLANSTITGTAKVGTTSVPGTWSYNASSTVPSVSDSNVTSYAVTFTPTDTNNFNSQSGTTKLVVNKATGYIASVTASGITYGQTLSNSTITGQFNRTVSGSFAWNSPSTKPTAGVGSFDWTFTPNDTANYSVQTGSVSVSVSKVTPTVTVSSVGAITYGQTLDNSAITGSATYQGTNVPGSFSWQNGSTIKPAVADSNVTTYTLVFQPTDSVNYNSVTLYKAVTVNKAQALTNPGSISLSATPIIYGQSLANSTISGTPASDVPGSYVWDDNSITPSVAESGRSYAVTFIPTDTANYDSVSGLSCAVIVNKATPVITDAIRNSISATAIIYGQSLADSVVTGDKPVTGSYAWANPAIRPSVSDSDVTAYDVVFTPSDTVNYNTTTLTATLTVYPAIPDVTDVMRQTIRATGIIYGDTLAASTLSGDTPVPGEYIWTNNSIAPAVSDSDVTPYQVTFVPTDNVNYTTVTGLTATLHVDKATPNITGDMLLTISASAIEYEQTLADSTLSGNVPVPGSYAWVDPTIAPTVADSNSTEYAVVFNPTDSANYNQVTGLKCKLVVTKATPVITDAIRNSVRATAITYGDTLADSTLSGSTPVPGDYSWADDTIAPSVSDSNTTQYAVIFTPTDTANYNNASLTTTLTVNPMVPVVTDDMRRSITATDIVYEQTLADSTLSGSTPVAGRYVWDYPDTMPSVADSNSTYYPVSFVPDDNVNYASVSGLAATLTVTKLSPIISQSVRDSIRASAVTYGDTLEDSILSGDTPRAGHWEWDDPDIAPVVSDSNTTDYVVKFVPDDTVNYDSAYTVARLVVNKYQPVITENDVQISAITYGDTLADAVISGDMPQLNGSDITGVFAWENDSIAPNAGTPSYNIVFTPDDLANVLPVTFEASLTVNKLVPVISDEMKQSIAATGIVYGQTLADSTLTGDVPIPGHYAWAHPETAPTVADSNATAFPVLFVPNDNNYANVEISCTLSVSKKVIVFSPDDIDSIVAEDLTYGERLGDSEITGNEPIPGTYHWTDESIVPSVNGDNNYPVEFIPDDTANYEVVLVGDVHVNVNKADPVITPAQVAAITATPLVYGQTLSASTVYGEASVSGNFAWADGSIKPSVADSESTLYSVIFTPDDTDNYNSITTAATVKVHKAIPMMPLDIDTWLKASPITYGQTLASSALTYGGNGVLFGNFVWQNPAIKPEIADSDTTDYPVLFVPSDTANYENMNYLVKVHVNKAPAPDYYQNMIDTISVKRGHSAIYELNNVIHLPEYQIASYRVSDESSIFTADPVINGNTISFSIKGSGSSNDQSAAISITISSRDYLDFNFTLVINASDCEHNGMTHIENQRTATCYEEGYTGDKVCDICCGTIEYGRVISKTEHTRKAENVVPATCAESGYSGDVVCSVCGEFIERGHTIDPLPHVEGDPVVEVPASEGVDGLQSYYCIICGKRIRSEVIPALEPIEPAEPIEPVVHEHVYSDAYDFDDCFHWRKCVGCDDVIDKDLHDYDDGEYITATCTTEGLVKYTCKTCGAVEIRLETPGHKLSEYKYSGNEHYKECIVCGERFDEHTHVYGNWVVVKAPTDESLGEYRHSCSICDYVEIEMMSSNPDDVPEIEVIVIPETEKPEDVEEPVQEPIIDDNEGDDTSNPYTGSRDTTFQFVAFAIIAGGAMWLCRRKRPDTSSDV